MKKSFLIMLILFVLTLVNCTKNDKITDVDLDIKEKMFTGQVNYVYRNYRKYVGKSIRLEGLMLSNKFFDIYDEEFYTVVRLKPDCCGENDVGFRVEWTKDETKTYPNDEAWVEAIGTLRVDSNGIYLDLISLKELNRRGARYVRH